MAELKSQLTSEGYIIHTEEKWNEQVAAINERKLRQQQKRKEETQENIVYRTIITVSKGMTSIDVGRALQKAEIIDESG